MTSLFPQIGRAAAAIVFTYVVAISDISAGMDGGFVHERLFRVFDSTKGARGMGIAAHQIRETIGEMGGGVKVDSTPGEGATLFLRIPLAGNETADDDTRKLD